jgi:hypothetical protein
MGEFIPSPDARQQLLIRKGDEQQLVWSVHLAGWLEYGWQVVSPPGLGAPSGAELLGAPHGAELASAPSGAELLGAPSGATPEVKPASRRSKKAAKPAPEPAAELPNAPSGGTPDLIDPLATELPDDLFDDPLS